MLKFFIFFTLVVIALGHPKTLRIARDTDTDGEANQNTLADPTEVKEDGTTVDERFGQGRPYGYGQPGYGQPVYGYGQPGHGYGRPYGGNNTVFSCFF
jgi:hypothetical protein